jgi:PadR family transcriptional regulator, regulatory protein PadR
MSRQDPSEDQDPSKRDEPPRADETGGGETPRQRSRRGKPPRSGDQSDPASAGAGFGWSFRDFLVPYILLALSMQRAHGYIIEQYLRGLGLARVEMSTLYRTLRQLERDGLVLSTWEPGPDGPARRVYSLTDAGRWWLDSSAAALEGYRALIDRFFGSYPGPAERPRPEDRTDDE